MILDIKKELCISDTTLRRELWEMYDATFQAVNAETPCRQHCHKEEFLEAMKDRDFQKFVLFVEEKPAGIGIITNHLEKVPWINISFFQKKFPEPINRGLLYYLVGIAVKIDVASMALGAKLLEKMICSLPESGAVAFDYSQTANRAIPLFAKRALHRSIEGETLDTQVYRIYQWGG